MDCQGEANDLAVRAGPLEGRLDVSSIFARFFAKHNGVLLVGGCVAVGMVGLLCWTTMRIDQESFEQERLVVETQVTELLGRVARAHEQVTVGDGVVTEVQRRPMDRRSIDAFFGPQVFFRLNWDGSYLVDGQDRVYYSMWKGRRDTPAALGAVGRVARPLVAELRAKMRHGRASVSAGSLSPEAADIAAVGGRLALVSVKPIVSDTGRIVQPPGTEHLSMLVIELGEAFSRRVGQRHHLSGVRVSLSDDVRRGEASHAYVSPRSGRPVGYFIWTPYRPGTVVLRHLIAPLLGALALFTAIVFFLVRRVRRSTAELEASEAQAKHLAFHDVLTGLPNRALFEDRLERALAAVRRAPDQKMALLCLDLDRFKQVNDTLGHPAGDELIRQLGRRLSAIVRDNDTVARLGGDEFAIIQTEVSSLADIESLCERILTAVDEPFDVIGSQAFVGMSIGVARSGIDGLDRTELARKADIALYQAKSSGRGRHVLFDDAMDEGLQLRQTLEQELRTALEQGGELEIYYQPLYEATRQSISGVEALVRWHHPRRGLVCPSVFIPVAEESGLIDSLGEWVLKEACAAGAHWPVPTISVNTSAVQIRNPFFAHKVLAILDETGLDPHRLELEITETSFLENVGQCEANLKMLRFAGVRIALDDFGTGYSSFNNLRNHQVDRLKIDQSFTTAIESSAEGSAIIRAIIALARSTGLKVTAEGIETSEQSNFLISAGCDELQGFLMAKPMPRQQIDQMLGFDPLIRKATRGKAAAPAAAASR